MRLIPVICALLYTAAPLQGAEHGLGNTIELVSHGAQPVASSPSSSALSSPSSQSSAGTESDVTLLPMSGTPLEECKNDPPFPLNTRTSISDVYPLAGEFLKAVNRRTEISLMSPPKEILAFLASGGIAYATTVGTWRDIVQAAYPILGLSVNLEDYVNESAKLNALVYFNLIAFHILQIPTYYAVFEPYIRQIIEKIACSAADNSILDTTGGKRVKRLGRSIPLLASPLDAAADLIRYIGNTEGLIRNQLTYPFFFLGMTAESYQQNTKLKHQLLKKFPSYDDETKQTRDQLLKWLDHAYNAIYFSDKTKDGQILSLYMAHSARYTEGLFKELQLMVGDYEKNMNVETVEGRSYLRIALQAAITGALVPLWVTNYYTLGKLMSSPAAQAFLSTILTGARVPRSISATGELYDYLVGMFSNYNHERNTGIRVPVDYIGQTSFRALLGSALYDVVLSAPMIMTYIALALEDEYSLGITIAGAIGVGLLESMVKQPIASNLTTFKTRVFYGDPIPSTYENKDYVYLGGMYNAGIGFINLLRGYTLNHDATDSNAAYISKAFVNWLIAGERVKTSVDAGALRSLLANLANAVRHGSVEDEIEPVKKKCFGLDWVANKFIGGFNYFFHRPGLTKEEQYKNDLLKFIRELSEQTGVAKEAVIGQLDQMINPKSSATDSSAVEIDLESGERGRGAGAAVALD